MTDVLDHLTAAAAQHRAAGTAARQAGDEATAERHFREALSALLEAAQEPASVASGLNRELLQDAARAALECGESAQARTLLIKAVGDDPALAHSEAWEQVRDVSSWPDAWLLAAVRRDPPDELALDTLVDRHWKPLFGRCQLLTLNRERAHDLAQEAWCRILRARAGLKPGGNFPAYIARIATNLWRDSMRSAQRAGPMADHRMASLDAELPGDETGTVLLADRLPDLNTSSPEEQTLLKLDIDRALAELPPILREVLVARYLNGESCAEIGRRYSRTEQSISAWVRDGVRQMKLYFERAGCVAAGKGE